jgi:hypothetical protein
MTDNSVESQIRQLCSFNVTLLCLQAYYHAVIFAKSYLGQPQMRQFTLLLGVSRNYSELNRNSRFRG